MMDTIRFHGHYLHKALPLHASVANMARRVLKIVREEYAAGRKVRNLLYPTIYDFKFVLLTCSTFWNLLVYFPRTSLKRNHKNLSTKLLPLLTLEMTTLSQYLIWNQGFLNTFLSFKWNSKQGLSALNFPCMQLNLFFFHNTHILLYFFKCW